MFAAPRIASCGSWTSRRLRAALYAYNHSDRYVDAVLAYAAVIRRNRAAYYGFHAWQVFVRTPSGYRRLTDP